MFKLKGARLSLFLLATLAFALTLPSGARADFPPYAKIVGISLVAPLSGPEKQLGLDLSAGVQAAIDDANQARGITDFGFVMHSFDDQGDPGIAQQQAQFALVDPTTSFVIGHIGGQETLLALHVYHEQGAPLIVPTCPLAQLTQQGYNNVFRICPSDIVEGQLDARYADRTLKASKVTVVWEEDDYGVNTATGFTNYAASTKMKTTDFSIDVDLKHLKDVVAKVKADNPSQLYITGAGADMVKVVKALHAAGVSAPILSSSTFYSDTLAKQLGSDATDMVASTCVPPINLMPTAAQFQRRYESRHGRLSAFALYGYAAAQIAISAAQQTRSTDKPTLIRELQNGIFTTVVGDVSFRTGGENSDPNLYFYRYTDGTFKYVGSAFPNPLILR